MPAFAKPKPARRAVIVAGMRTPFARAFGPLMEMDTIALGVAAVRGLMEKTAIPWKEIDGVVWGGVVLPATSANIAREIALDVGLPPTVECGTVSRACTSSLVAITQAAAAIERGEHEVMIAGGSDSTSNAQVCMPNSFVHKSAPVLMSGKATVKDYFALMARLSVRDDLLPQRPAVRERTTGELMGESTEKMAERNQIPREAQDALAFQSHQRAARAIASGRLAKEIVPVDLPGGGRLHQDTLVRGDTTLEKLAALRPAFKKDGTLTAGNSTALTDGAGGVLLMSAAKAKALGYRPLAALRSWAYHAVDPADQLLIGPAISMPVALDRAGVPLAEVDMIELHEAFAAQVLSVLKALASDGFAREYLGRDRAVGEIDPDAINLYGGSIALGHPFAATGARIVTTATNELGDTDKRFALVGICAAGGLSGAAVLEKV